MGQTHNEVLFFSRSRKIRKRFSCDTIIYIFSAILTFDNIENEMFRVNHCQNRDLKNHCWPLAVDGWMELDGDEIGWAVSFSFGESFSGKLINILALFRWVQQNFDKNEQFIHSQKKSNKGHTRVLNSTNKLPRFSIKKAHEINFSITFKFESEVILIEKRYAKEKIRIKRIRK